MAATEKRIVVKSASMEVVALKIVGTAPLLQHRMSAETIQALKDRAIKGKMFKVQKGAARDLDAEYNEAMHITADGRLGHPASAFRNAMIRAAQGFGYTMSEMKSVVFIEADALSVNGNPLVLINGDVQMREDVIPGNKPGGAACLIVRPMITSWSAVVRVRFPTERTDAETIANICQAAGQTVGIGCGRPQSTNSNGIGMGTWEIDTGKKAKR